MDRLDPELEAELHDIFVARFIAAWAERDIDLSEIEEVSFRSDDSIDGRVLEVTFQVTASVRTYPWSGTHSDAIEVVEQIAALNASDAEYDRRVRTGERPRRTCPGF